MKKFVSTGVVVLAALSLAACSADSPEEPTAPAATTDSTTGASEPTSSAAPTLGNQDDPLCAEAQESVTTSEAVFAKSNELTAMFSDTAFLTSDDATELNAWGEAMLQLTAESADFYVVGVEHTQGEDINADFVLMGSFVDDYSGALAQSAADAATPGDFFADMQEQMTSAEVRTVLQEAPNSAERIHDYLVERCGITG